MFEVKIIKGLKKEFIVNNKLNFNHKGGIMFNIDFNIILWVATGFMVLFTVIFGVLLKDGFKDKTKSKVIEVLIILSWIVMLISVGMLWYIKIMIV